MNFQTAVDKCFRSYATIRGRASRSEFWYWVLFVMIAMAICAIIDGTVFGITDPATGAANNNAGPVGTILALAILIPHVCVSVRRLHDTERSGWWLLINFIPILGIILLIVWFATKGTDGPNRFGDDPLPLDALPPSA